MHSPSVRTALCALAALAAGAATPSLRGQATPTLNWVDVADWPLEGRAFEKKAAPFDRLPAAARAKVRQAVWRLSRHSAGMAARFVTDAREIHVRYRLTQPALSMYHMPATGVSGVDLYARDDAGQLKWVAVSRPSKQEVTQRLCADIAAPPNGGREFVLYLPLYNGVEQLEIGVPEGARIAPTGARAAKPVVVYGTSIAHGACASRPGMAWPAIVGRILDREVINLGFSGNGRMEEAVGAYVATIDAAVFVVDCLPNMSADQVRQRTAPLVRQLRDARPDAHVLLVEDRAFTNAWIHPPRARAHARRRAALRAAYGELQSDHAYVHYLEGEHLLGSDAEGATDGSHPNDLGMMRQARAVAAALEKALR